MAKTSSGELGGFYRVFKYLILFVQALATIDVPMEYKRCSGEFSFHRFSCSFLSANSITVDFFISFVLGVVSFSSIISTEFVLVTLTVPPTTD
jgi:hypothetical protein